MSLGEAAAQVDWRGLYLPEHKKPVVYFPGTYSDRTDTVNTNLGESYLRRFYYSDPEGVSGNRLYTLTILDYPAGSIPEDSTALRTALFAETAEATTSSVAGTLMFAEALDQGPWPGYLFRVDYNAGAASMYNQAYFVGDRYYHLQVFATESDSGVRSRKRFFENFRPPLTTPGEPK